MRTEREKALATVLEDRSNQGSALEYIFALILQALRPERQDLRDRYFLGLKRAFPIEFRMCEAWLLEGEFTEFPDGPADLLHWMEERHLQFVESERKIRKALDGELQEILTTVGPTADPLLAPPEQPGFDPDLWGDTPN